MIKKLAKSLIQRRAAVPTNNVGVRFIEPVIERKRKEVRKNEEATFRHFDSGCDGNSC